MQTSELVKLLDDINGQLILHDRAKAGEEQSMIDFVRFCVLRNVWNNKLISPDEKIKAFERLMELVVLTVAKEIPNG